MAIARTALVPAPTSELDINHFFLQNGRLPRLGDKIAPWEYRGWLRWYCQLAHGHPDAVDRWGYYMRTLEAGHLLDEPIPQIVFTDSADTAVAGMLWKAIDFIYDEAGSWSAFAMLVDWIAWGMGVSAGKPEFSAKLNERLYRHFDLAPLLLNPHDYLGMLYAEGKGRWNPHAFFPTPHSVVECMVQMTRAQGCEQEAVEKRDPRTFSICDPAVGSGRMLLHASNFSFCLFGSDIDLICCRLTAINGVLYAPWLAFPFSSRILGVPVPEPVPAPLPIPKEHQRADKPAHRVDDHGQGLLFG